MTSPVQKLQELLREAQRALQRLQSAARPNSPEFANREAGLRPVLGQRAQEMYEDQRQRYEAVLARLRDAKGQDTVDVKQEIRDLVWISAHVSGLVDSYQDNRRETEYLLQLSAGIAEVPAADLAVLIDR